MKMLKGTLILICCLSAFSQVQAENSKLSIEFLWEKEFKGATYFNPDTAELMSTNNGMITIYNSDGSIKYSKKRADIVRGDRHKEIKPVSAMKDETVLREPKEILAEISKLDEESAKILENLQWIIEKEKING
ncbi:hypothetical protein K8T06_09350 [bacterium]|nr:hypothetical protein [bacterium]